MLKVWINNNDNNEILKVGLVIIIVGFWKFGLMMIRIIVSRWWKCELITMIIIRFLKVRINDNNNNNK